MVISILDSPNIDYKILTIALGVLIIAIWNFANEIKKL
jgi:hypothetical protein